MPETPLGFITPGMRFMAWERAPVDVMRLALRCVIRNGIRRIWVAESMNDVETDLRVSRIAKEEGADGGARRPRLQHQPGAHRRVLRRRARGDRAPAPMSTCSTSRIPAGCSRPSASARSCRPCAARPRRCHSRCIRTARRRWRRSSTSRPRASEHRSSAPPCGRSRTARRSRPPSRRSRTCARRASRWRSTRTRWRRCPPTSRRSPLASAGPSARRSSTTSRSTATSSRAA